MTSNPRSIAARASTPEAREARAAAIAALERLLEVKGACAGRTWDVRTALAHLQDIQRLYGRREAPVRLETPETEQLRRDNAARLMQQTLSRRP